MGRLASGQRQMQPEGVLKTEAREGVGEGGGALGVGEEDRGIPLEGILEEGEEEVEAGALEGEEAGIKKHEHGLVHSIQCVQSFVQKESTRDVPSSCCFDVSAN
jgi:hypothetical protein